LGAFQELHFPIPLYYQVTTALSHFMSVTDNLLQGKTRQTDSSVEEKMLTLYCLTIGAGEDALERTKVSQSST
jgi:hypothetical protein